MSGWIPMAVRRPPEGRFLVTRRVANGNVYVDVLIYSPGNVVPGVWDSVTHWMHLPEPAR